MSVRNTNWAEMCTYLSIRPPGYTHETQSQWRAELTRSQNQLFRHSCALDQGHFGSVTDCQSENAHSCLRYKTDLASWQFNVLDHPGQWPRFGHDTISAAAIRTCEDAGFRRIAARPSVRRKRRKVRSGTVSTKRPVRQQ